MRRSWILVCSLAVGLGAHTVAAEEPARTDARIRAGLCSPLDGVRLAAYDALLREPARARQLARAWVTHERPVLREQAWRLLQAAGQVADVERALAAAQTEEEAPVAAAAAAALLSLAGRFPHLEGPWLREGTEISEQRRRLLALALLVPLRETTDVPQCVMHLGERCTPWLLQAFHLAQGDQRARSAVMRSLGRLACASARAALAGLPAPPTSSERATWLDALRACGEGPELEPVHRWILGLALSDSRRGRRSWPRGRTWSRQAREALYRLLAACPDDRWAEPVCERLRQVVGVTSWHASLVVAAVRTLVVLADPTDDDLELIIDAGASPPWPRRESGRHEGLGDVFRALLPYKERPALQEQLEGRDGSAVPRTSKAWIALLSKASSKEAARTAATNLLYDEPPLIPCLRAGARILDRCGGPTQEILADFVSHDDPWLRAWALRWVPRVMPRQRANEVLGQAARDAHDGVAMVVAERLEDVEHDLPLMRRTLRTAAFHSSQTTRSRAWRVLERVLRAGTAADASTSDEVVLPRGDAPMDDRLRAAATVRAWIRASSSAQDHDEALPDRGGKGK